MYSTNNFITYLFKPTLKFAKPAFGVLNWFHKKRRHHWDIRKTQNNCTYHSKTKGVCHRFEHFTLYTCKEKYRCKNYKYNDLPEKSRTHHRGSGIIGYFIHYALIEF